MSSEHTPSGVDPFPDDMSRQRVEQSLADAAEAAEEGQVHLEGGMAGLLGRIRDRGFLARLMRARHGIGNQSLSDDSANNEGEDGEQAGEGEGDETPPAPAPPQPKGAAELAEAAELARLYQLPVPIILSKQTLRRSAPVSCGGSHVVKFKDCRELRGVKNLESVLPERDMFVASKDARIFDTCAVVGNSGSLLESQHGAEIDSHSVVIRFNAGITEGYEQFVGSKTTFRLLNNPASAPKEAGEITIATIRDSDIKEWVKSIIRNPERAESAFAIDPEFLCYTWLWVKQSGHKPSSGLVGIILALKLCHKIHVYGFNFSSYFSRTSRPHYYDWERPAKGREKVHPFQHEVSLYEQLAKNGYINLVH
eukprot:jgi/Mesvir1/2287/Mv19325-RA.1